MTSHKPIPSRLRRALLLLLVQAGLLADIPAFLGSNCLSCHGPEDPKAGLDLSTLPLPGQDPRLQQRWTTLHDRVLAGEMPPPNKRQPSPAERASFLSELADRITQADLQRHQLQGRVVLRRLNRSEYENTVRDLFDLPGIVVRDLLPEDGRQDGFSKASSALEVSAVQLQRYMEAADRILDHAIATHDKPIVWKGRFRMLSDFTHLGQSTFPISQGRVDMDLLRRMAAATDRIPFLKDVDQADALGMITPARVDFTPHVGRFSPHAAGPFRIRTRVFSFRLGAGGSLEPVDRGQWFALSTQDRFLAWLDAPPIQPAEHVLTNWLEPGDSLILNPASLWPHFLSVLHPSTPAAAAQMRWRDLRHPFHFDGPAAALEFLEVEGPLIDSWPPESHRRIFGDLPFAKAPDRTTKPLRPHRPLNRPGGSRPNGGDDPRLLHAPERWTVSSPDPARDLPRILAPFLTRAFRRPVPDAVVQPYVRLASDRLAAGEPFEEAVRAAVRTALCSPEFLFLQEPTSPTSNPADGRPLDAHALAARLSCFLWNSTPDEQLAQAARANQLDRDTLLQHARRLLAHPRSDRFIEDFLDQWLVLRDIDFTTPDVTLYPEFRADLRHAMLAESRAFFRHLLDQDLGVRNFIDSDTLFLNQRLAEHYDIPGVRGSHIRPVPRPARSPRGGFLTQAAILKVTANGTSTSPVKRGAWVLDRLLGTPPSPPPPNTPAVEPDIRGATTIRQQLDRHRNSPACAACHVHIDPPGFALESFDVIGGWRSHYRFLGPRHGDPEQRPGKDPGFGPFPGILPHAWAEVINTVRLGAPVDATGVTDDGKPFNDIFQFKELLLTHQEQVARAFVHRLVLYATGAPVDFADRQRVTEILDRTRPSGHGVRSLVLEVIGSPLFRQK